jgi:hypothetical protein
LHGEKHKENIMQEEEEEKRPIKNHTLRNIVYYEDELQSFHHIYIYVFCKFFRRAQIILSDEKNNERTLTDLH